MPRLSHPRLFHTLPFRSYGALVYPQDLDDKTGYHRVSSKVACGGSPPFITCVTFTGPAFSSFVTGVSSPGSATWGKQVRGSVLPTEQFHCYCSARASAHHCITQFSTSPTPSAIYLTSLRLIDNQTARLFLVLGSRPFAPLPRSWIFGDGEIYRWMRSVEGACIEGQDRFVRANERAQFTKSTCMTRNPPKDGHYSRTIRGGYHALFVRITIHVNLIVHSRYPKYSLCSRQTFVFHLRRSLLASTLPSLAT